MPNPISLKVMGPASTLPTLAPVVLVAGPANALRALAVVPAPAINRSSRNWLVETIANNNDAGLKNEKMRDVPPCSFVVFLSLLRALLLRSLFSSPRLVRGATRPHHHCTGIVRSYVRTLEALWLRGSCATARKGRPCRTIPEVITAYPPS